MSDFLSNLLENSQSQQFISQSDCVNNYTNDLVSQINSQTKFSEYNSQSHFNYLNSQSQNYESQNFRFQKDNAYYSQNDENELMKDYSQSQNETFQESNVKAGSQFEFSNEIVQRLSQEITGIYEYANNSLGNDTEDRNININSNNAEINNKSYKEKEIDKQSNVSYNNYSQKKDNVKMEIETIIKPNTPVSKFNGNIINHNPKESTAIIKNTTTHNTGNNIPYITPTLHKAKREFCNNNFNVNTNMNNINNEKVANIKLANAKTSSNECHISNVNGVSGLIADNDISIDKTEVDNFKAKIGELKASSLGYLDEIKVMYNNIIEDQKNKILDYANQIERILSIDTELNIEEIKKTKQIEKRIDTLLKEVIELLQS